METAIHGGFPKLGVPFLGPYNKDYSILGYIGVPLFRETTTYIYIYEMLQVSH